MMSFNTQLSILFWVLYVNGLTRLDINNSTWMSNVTSSLRMLSFDGSRITAEKNRFYEEEEDDDDDGEDDVSRNVTVLVENVWPFLVVKDENKTSGYVGMVWHVIEEYLKLKPVFINATIKDLVFNGTVDVSLVPISIDSKYLERFDCTASLGKSWFNFYVNGAYHRSQLIYSSIWTDEMLYSNIALLFSCVLIQWSMLNFCSVDSRKASSKDEDHHSDSEGEDDIDRDNSFINTFIDVYGLVLQKGSQVNEGYCSVRILRLIYSGFGMLMLTSYTTLLISRITTTQRFTTLGGIVHDLNQPPSQYSVCLHECAHAYKALNESNTEKDVRFLLKWNETFNRYPCTAGQMSGRRLFVPASDYCHFSTLVLEEYHYANWQLINGKIKCKILRDKRPYFTSHLALALKKGFRYKERINQFLLRMQSHGVLQRLKNFWLPKGAEDGIELPNILEYSVSFDHIRDLVTKYLIMVIISLLILFIEILVYNINAIVNAIGTWLKIV